MTRKIPEEAFETYYALGAERSYQAIAERYDVSKGAVVKHATRERWQERIREREARARARADQEAVESIEAVNRRHLKAVRAVQAKALEALRSMSIESAMDAVRALDLAIKQERLVIGEPTDRSAVSVEDVIRREYDRWISNEEE
ncbi:MAG: hypothetical protein R3F49_25350 [Planctomycetota bacterium]